MIPIPCCKIHHFLGLTLETGPGMFLSIDWYSSMS